jgi:hypothetical protein
MPVHRSTLVTVMVSMFTVAFKVAAVASVVAASIFLYRKFRARKRPGRPRRLLP